MHGWQFFISPNAKPHPKCVRNSGTNSDTANDNHKIHDDVLRISWAAIVCGKHIWKFQSTPSLLKAERVSASIQKYLHQLHKQFYCGQFSEIFSRFLQDKERKKKNSSAPQTPAMGILLILWRAGDFIRLVEVKGFWIGWWTSINRDVRCKTMLKVIWDGQWNGWMRFQKVDTE